MKRKILLIGLFLICISGLIVNISFYNKDVVKGNLFLANEYSEDAKYLLIYDLNGGEEKGFAGYTKIREGVYGLNEFGSQKLEYSSLLKRNNHYILYWSKDHLCSTNDLEVEADPKVTTHTVFYACYEQTEFDKDGIRYVKERAYVSGDNVSSGDRIRVKSCYKQWRYSSGREYGVIDYCEFDQINGKSASGVVFRNQLSTEKPVISEKVYTAYFHEDSYNVDGDGFECGETSYYKDGVCYASGSEVKLPNTNNLKFGNRKFIGWAADDDGKNVNCSGTLITGNSVKLTSDISYYACYEELETCNNTSSIPNGKGSYDIKVCYEAYMNNEKKELDVKPKTEDYDKILTCAKGYNLSEVSKSTIIETTCNSVGNCYKIYKLSCVGEKPKISASVGIVSGKYGNIEFSANSSVGIKGWYASEYFQKPTVKSEWNMDSKGKYTLPAAPGSVFLWVIDNSNQISYAVMTSVIDKINVDTTLKNLEVKDSNGEKLNISNYSYDYYTDINSNNYALLSNTLNSKLLANSFNPFDTAYTVKTSSDKIAVYATLTSDDASYVPGYEPRTVDLDYGINTILIKIKNKKGIERTYTILVTREDDRDANNYLKSLTVSEGKINFNQYTNDYIVSVGKNKKSVSIGGELASLKANFVDGFGPRTIKLNNDSTTAAIKVRSETGSIRSYVITFIKSEKEINDDKDIKLSSLSLSKAYIAFDKNITDYNTTVDYEIDSIDIYALAENGGDSVMLYKLDNGVQEKIDFKNIELNVGNNTFMIIVSSKDNKSIIYNINIVRKENGLDISSNNELSLLDVKGYNIDFNSEKLDYEIKIKREKTLLITATPLSNKSEVYIRGNDNLTAFSIVKIKVVSEDGQSREYTIDIKKDTFNKNIELIALISGVVIIVCGIIVIRIKKNRKSVNDYYA